MPPLRHVPLLAVALTLLLGGCANGVPGLVAFRYLSLEATPGARVVTVARPDPQAYHFGIGTIPTGYEIRRERYRLVLTVPVDGWYNVGIRVRVEPSDYRIGFYSESEIRGSVGCPVWAPWQDGGVQGWEYGLHFGCMDRVIRKRLGNRLRFTVFDGQGVPVGEESIPYRVRRRGFYGYRDAI